MKIVLQGFLIIGSSTNSQNNQIILSICLSFICLILRQLLDGKH